MKDTTDDTEALRDIADVCGVGLQDIEDVYPCTPLQVGIMAQPIERIYINCVYTTLAPSIDADRFCDALHQVVSMNPVLRTRIVDCDFGLVQVVLKENPPIARPSQSLERVLYFEKSTPMHFGSPLFRAALLGRKLILTTHHAIADGGTYHRLFYNMSRVYHGQSLPLYADFKLFVKHCLSIEETMAKSFWASRFSGQPTVFPNIDLEYIPDASKRLQTRVDFGPWGLGVPLGLMSSYIETAWAMTVKSYTNADSVVFGRVLSGRVPGLRGLESTLGPTIVTMPVQINLKNGSTIAAVIKERAQERRESLKSPALQYGLTRIRSVSEAARIASRFTTLLNFRTPTDDGRDYSNSDMEIHDEYEPHLPYGLGISIVVDDVGLSVETLFDDHVVCERQTIRILRQFEHILHLLLQSPAGTGLDQLQLLNPHDRREILDWNEIMLDPPRQSLHNYFRNIARTHPNDAAVQSHDGHTNYEQLDRMSDSIAGELQRRGIGTEDAIGLVFEKSIWAVVAQLAVLKAGAVCVPMDPGFPLTRKKTIISTSKAAMILTSATHENSLSDLVPSVMVVSAESVSQLPMLMNQRPIVGDTPSQAAFILFTSGSTGTPKGHILEHRNLVSSLKAIGRDMNWKPGVRMLQFASYVWDMSIAEIFGMLLFGGCVCVPSEEARESFIAGFIQSQGVNCAIFTPTVLRMITPQEAPSLKTLMSIGEPVDLESMKIWSGHARFFNAWGPSETACVSAMAELTPTSPYPESIGKPLASAIWLVDEKNVEKLVAVGGVGEIVVEGLGVARGYLSNQDQTAASFISPPRWAPPRKGDLPTKPQRMYRTGDLAKYNPDGSLEYIGRHDNQVKINGQRVELGEVEKVLSSCTAVRRAITSVQGSRTGTSHKDLVAVLSLEKPHLPTRTPLKELSAELLPEVEECLKNIREVLTSRLPSYMVPTVWRVVEELPRTTSLKIDRSSIKKWLRQWEPTHLTGSGSDELTPPASEIERILHAIWSTVLYVPESEIGRESSFIRLGGDSILAINIATKCRKRGIRVSVATLLRSESLANVAAASEMLPGHYESLGEGPVDDGAKTSLLQVDDEDLRGIQTYLNAIGIDMRSVEALLPCSPLQEGILLSQLKSSGRSGGLDQHVFEVREHISPTQLHEAWNLVAANCPALRTRIVELGQYGVCQVTLKTVPDWTEEDSLSEYLHWDKDVSIRFGRPLCRFGEVREPSGMRYFVLSVHHTIYDPWTLSLALDAFRNACDGVPLSPLESFGTFMRRLPNRVASTADDYWKARRQCHDMPQFPRIPSEAPNANRSSSRSSNLEGSTEVDILRAAWALCLSRLTGEDNISFGIYVDGRNTLVKHIARVTGPVGAVVPCAMDLTTAPTGEALLRLARKCTDDFVPFLDTEFPHRTHETSHDKVWDCSFKNILVIDSSLATLRQPASEALKLIQTNTPAGSFGDARLVVHCRVMPNETYIKMQFDGQVVPSESVDILLEQYKHAVRQLRSRLMTPLADLEPVSNHELSLLRAWNRDIPVGLVTYIHEQIRVVAKEHRTAPAVCSWDHNLDHGELDDLSDRMAIFLQSGGVAARTVVPYFIEKSTTAIILMLGILKAGGTLLPLDIDHPPERIARVLSDSCASVIVTSTTLSNRVRDRVTASSTVVVDMKLIRSLPPGRPESIDIKPSDTCYIIYTSGSTGRPKGVMITHSNFSTSVKYRRELVNMTSTTRTLQYLNFIFDVSMFDVFLTLVSGGCVCLPSEEEWFNDISGAIQRTRSNFAFLTPSLATLLDPSEVPTLCTLGLTGEPFQRHIIEQWGHICVLNMYGPAEATVHSSGCDVSVGSGRHHLNIGRPGGCLYWVVDPNDPNHLVPIGCPGELLIQGPIVSRGYVGDPDMTEAVFIDPPSWMRSFELLDTPPESQFSSQINFTKRCYKTGDLVVQTWDGSVIYQGRKDNQVKLRGQRIELGEIEHHLRRSLRPQWNIAVELIKPSGQDQDLCLAVFFTVESPKQSKTPEMPCKLLSPLPEEASALRSALNTALPAYMVPQFFVWLNRLPFTSSGKIDRGSLRSIGATLSPRRLSSYNSSHEIPNGNTKPLPSATPNLDDKEEKRLTDLEADLQQLWSETLSSPLDTIKATDNFFNIGGSSIRAMRLSHAARRSGIVLSAADVFKTPVFS
ncbi:hypothetical protein BJ170DRAFT_574622, partial [Xylariales sp. AK1849]